MPFLAPAIPYIVGAGAAAGGLAKGKAGQRQQQQQTEQDIAGQRLDNETAREGLRLREADERREAERNALLRLMQGEYMAGGGSTYAPPTVGGTTAPSYGFGPRGMTEAEMEAGRLTSDRSMGTLRDPNLGHAPGTITPFDEQRIRSLSKPGFWEKLAGGISLAGAGLEAMTGLKDRGQSSQFGQSMSPDDLWGGTR